MKEGHVRFLCLKCPHLAPLVGTPLSENGQVRVRERKRDKEKEKETNVENRYIQQIFLTWRKLVY